MASLVADYSSSSESDTEGESDSDHSDSAAEEKEKSHNNVNQKLPPPEFGASKNSVFSNPFVEAENAKKAILEKHVKMTPTRDEIKMINGKKICWNFRKGRCRFGHNCKFAHDSDLQSNSDKSSESVLPGSDINPLHNQVIPIVDEDTQVDIDASNTLSKKKRPGLSQTLVPGKKVMNMYKKQKVKDSWDTVSKKNR